MWIDVRRTMTVFSKKIQNLKRSCGSISFPLHFKMTMCAKEKKIFSSPLTDQNVLEKPIKWYETKGILDHARYRFCEISQIMSSKGSQPNLVNKIAELS